MQKRKIVYPFSAIVGQEKLKLALLVNLVDPNIGGLLIVGTKGSGKSMAVRALADLAPEIEVVEGCPFNCDPYDPKLMCEKCRARYELKRKLPVKKVKMPFIQLPLSATEDRVVGSLDIEKAITEGKKVLQPGLLAEANRGILFIDEVNLLPDNLTDLILDACALRWNHIERDGITLSHPSKFILIGTMNPEEGWLRPQILDRFPLCIRIEELKNPKDRMEIILRNTEFEENPMKFLAKWQSKQEELRKMIMKAKEILPKIKVSEEIQEKIAEFCLKLMVDGHRPDMAIIKTARAIAALNQRPVVNIDDLVQATQLALAHRSRKKEIEGPLSPEEIEQELLTTIITEGKGEEEEIKKIKVDLGESGELPARITPPKIKPKSYTIPRRLGIILIIALYYLLFYFAFAAGSIAFSGFLNVPLEKVVDLMRKDLFLWAAISLLIFLILQGIGRVRRGEFVVVGVKETPIREYKRIKAHRLLIKEHIVAGKPKPQVFGKKAWQFISLFGATILQKYRAAIEKGRKLAENIFDLMLPPPSTFKLSLTPEHMRGKRRRAEVVRGIWLRKGKYVKHAMPRDKPWDIAIAPTLRAAAPYQRIRKPSKLAIKVEPGDIRVKMREYKQPLCIVILLDMSESMIVSLENVKNAIRGLHKGAYRHRDKVGLIVFKGQTAEVLQQPTTNLKAVTERLLKVGASDFTPLATGMLKAYEILKLERLKSREIIPVLVIISDGIANVPLEHPLSYENRKKFLNPAQADVVDIAKRMTKAKIRTIIINTDHRSDEIYKKIYYGANKTTFSYTPTALLMEVARITRGKYYGLSVDRPGETIIIPEVIAEIAEIAAPTIEEPMGPLE